MATQLPQVTSAFRIDRLPIFSQHHRLAMVVGIGTPFISFSLLRNYGPAAVFLFAAAMLAIRCLDVSILGPTNTGTSLDVVSQ